MLYNEAKILIDTEFKRKTGVQKQTFNKMVEILIEAEILQKKRGGRKNKLSIPNRLLMTLEYLREYRTYFHISHDYGIKENTCFRNIKWVESVLIKTKEFVLPSKKILDKLPEETDIEIVLIDATETAIERPKRYGKQKKFIQESSIETQ
jgi:hypothetical protein